MFCVLPLPHRFVDHEVSDATRRQHAVNAVASFMIV
jgi:hypothetical protein